MSAYHQQIDIMFADEPRERVPDIADPEKCFVLYSAELFIETSFYFLFQLFLLLKMSRPQVRRSEQVVVGGHDVGSVYLRPILTSDCRGIRQSRVGMWREISRK